MHGFLNIDKPAGITSHDVVARVRRLARQKRVGHAGTLDPAATGVLVLALGNATRLIEYVQDATSKRYLATVQLGAATTTDDAEGEVVARAPVPALDGQAIEALLERFRGEILQVPPMYAALHHQGRRLHELARAGIVVDRIHGGDVAGRRDGSETALVGRHGRVVYPAKLRAGIRPW